MPGNQGLPPITATGAAAVAQEIMSRAGQDVVFGMRFIGESQLLLQEHFKSFIAAELEKRAVTHDHHPLLQYFIDSHANELREFVFAGVALSHQFQIGEIGRFAGDASTVMHVDIWDSLVSYIETAEGRFLAEVADLPTLLARIEGEAEPSEDRT